MLQVETYLPPEGCPKRQHGYPMERPAQVASSLPAACSRDLHQERLLPALPLAMARAGSSPAALWLQQSNASHNGACCGEPMGLPRRTLWRSAVSLWPSLPPSPPPPPSLSSPLCLLKQRCFGPLESNYTGVASCRETNPAESSDGFGGRGY